ncbi:heat shock 22 kDa protein, mitochondrial-like [Olea europaea var. sylvestris]|uniref:heat shock 22 kDa protein, mitochondrial-like n=1 Tax=Olea europaea var. sylvestris TaxID=158386 RepID=UPI000C1D1351|nr:heat shock 22 kDa protein, mitochondrial-like [Olea europaea var. sylvestris]
MASYLALRRLVSSSLSSPSLLLSPETTVRVVAQPLSSRLFNTAAHEYDSDDCNPAVGPRSFHRLCSPFSVEAVDPLSSRSISQILNTIDLFKYSPLASGIPQNCDMRETGDGLSLRMDMPGLGKKDIKVSVEQNTLIIKGEGEKEFEDDKSGRTHTIRIVLPKNLYKTNDIKAEMKNGVLKVLIPKIKEEERNDVFHVQVE